MCSCGEGKFGSVDDLLAATSELLAGLPVRERIRACRRTGAHAEAVETASAAELIPDNGDTRAAQRALADPKRTKGEARRVAKRAAVAAKNSSIAAKMGSRELSGEQVDAIARADSKTDGAASTDEGLIADLAGATADETKGIVDKFIVDQANADSVEKEHRRQRALREVTRHRTSLGLAALTVAGDDASIDAMYRQLRADEKALFLRDGGRDVPEVQHPRNRGNRLFDAFKARITGSGDPLDPPEDHPASASNGHGSSRNDAARNAGHDRNAAASNEHGFAADGAPNASADHGAAGQTPRPCAAPTTDSGQERDSTDSGPETAGRPNPTCDDGENDPADESVELPPPDGSSDPPPLKAAEPSFRYTPPAARRPTVIAVLDLAKLAGTDPSLLAEQIGLGPIPGDILAKYLGDAALGVDPQQCHMHHRIPWNAPAKGETNIDNLVLLCSHCHHRLHQQKQTLYRDRTTGKWRKRPATPDELPRDRPRRQQQKQERPPDQPSQPGRRRPKAA